MKSVTRSVITILMLFALMACDSATQEMQENQPNNQQADNDVRGPHNGRLLREGDFTLELAIFETGVPPEYRAWASQAGEALPPSAVDLQINLTRLGARDEIHFSPQGDFLRGTSSIYEPHSFSVEVTAQYGARSYRWAFDSFEGRTLIEPEVAASLGIETEVVGPQIIENTAHVYGEIVMNTEKLSHISARFDGRIKAVHAQIGERVREGARLATIESNQSLTDYDVLAPISGVILARDAGPGEQSAGRELFTILDDSIMWVDLALFPQVRAQLKEGAIVQLYTPFESTPRTATLSRFLPQLESNQSTIARVSLPNPDGALQVGTWIEARITLEAREVPFAVRRNALQSFRDFTVVFAQFGNEYEVRMLELGAESDDWVEVLGGIAAGTTYVTENSYIIKADVEKSGASHDH